MIMLVVLTGTSYARGGHSGSHSRGASKSSQSSTKVRGYTKKNGTYVPTHHRTIKDHTKMNNYSTKGNINPYTGKEGNKDPSTTRGGSK